jgi:hypothetical protein
MNQECPCPSCRDNTLEPGSFLPNWGILHFAYSRKERRPYSSRGACCHSDTETGQYCSTMVTLNSSGMSPSLPVRFGSSLHFGRRPVTSGLPQQAENAGAGRHVSKVPIFCKSSFWEDERNFLEPLMRITSSDVRGPYRFIQNRPGTSIVALKSDAAAEESKDQLSRDFSGRSIFDFCNKICQQRTSANPVHENEKL